MAEVSSELNQIFKILVCRRHGQSFLKGLQVPALSINNTFEGYPSQPLVPPPAHPICNDYTWRPVQQFAQGQWLQIKKLSLRPTTTGIFEISPTPQVLLKIWVFPNSWAKVGEAEPRSPVLLLAGPLPCIKLSWNGLFLFANQGSVSSRAIKMQLLVSKRKKHFSRSPGLFQYFSYLT